MDLYPKYIIEVHEELGKCLILSNCTYHKELVTNKERILGGGWFKLDGDVFTFHGKSQDFGRAKIEDVKECIVNNNVYVNKYLTHSIADKFKFRYDRQSEIVYL